MSCPALEAKSRPAQKCFPSAPSTMARHQPVRSSSSYASATSRSRAVSKKLLGGRRSHTTPTCSPCCSRETESLTAPFEGRRRSQRDVLHAAPVDQRVLTVDGLGDPAHLGEAKAFVERADRVGLEDQVELQGVVAEPAGLEHRVLDERSPDA